MFSKGQWLWRRVTRQLWSRVVLFSLLAVLVALAAAFVKPDGASVLDRFTPQVVDNILGILASSMLGVSTFSLSIMVSAFASAASGGTPRATQLVMQDSTTQNALAIFIGVFVYSLVGIIALSLGVYGPGGRAVLFLVTILVVVVMLVALLRWINHLSTLGRLPETMERVERAAAGALRDRVEQPYLGCAQWADAARTPPPGARAVLAGDIGYVEHVHVEPLDDFAQDRQCEVYLAALPGDFAHEGRPLAYVVGAKEIDPSALAAAFTIGKERSYDQDPRFGLIVLAEIASRALSPAVNDPGTAIGIIGRAMRLLAIWRARETAADPEPVYPHVRAPALATDDLFADVFTPIARDGAGLVEVQIRLQKALAALAQMGGPATQAAARRQSRQALARAEAALAIEDDKAAARQAAAWSA